MNIFTSLAPSRLDIEKDAVNFLQELSFNVYSVNGPEEAAKLSPVFPKVKFLITSDTIEKVVKKPCVKISSLLNWAVTMTPPEAGPVFGIINSDIFLLPRPEIFSRIKEAALFSCVAIHRTESKDDRVYLLGFDAFFLSRRAAALVRPADFAMGMPAWDYWLPVLLMSKGVPLVRVEEKIAIHPSHNPAWNGYQMALYRRYAETLGLGTTDDMYARIMVNSTLLKGD